MRSGYVGSNDYHREGNPPSHTFQPPMSDANKPHPAVETSPQYTISDPAALDRLTALERAAAEKEAEEAEAKRRELDSKWAEASARYRRTMTTQAAAQDTSYVRRHVQEARKRAGGGEQKQRQGKRDRRSAVIPVPRPRQSRHRRRGSELKPEPSMPTFTTATTPDELTQAAAADCKSARSAPAWSALARWWAQDAPLLEVDGEAGEALSTVFSGDNAIPPRGG